MQFKNKRGVQLSGLSVARYGRVPSAACAGMRASPLLSHRPLPSSMKGPSFTYIYVWYACMFIHVCECTCKQVIQMCVCMHGDQRLISGSSFIPLHLFCQGRVSYLNREVSDSARLVISFSGHALSPPHTGVTDSIYTQARDPNS